MPAGTGGSFAGPKRHVICLQTTLTDHSSRSEQNSCSNDFDFDSLLSAPGGIWKYESRVFVMLMSGRLRCSRTSAAAA